MANSYWRIREARQLKYYVTEEKEYDKQIRQIYMAMLDACQKDIESFYAKYAKAEGITLAEAKRRVRKLDIEAYERKAKRYVKNKTFSQKANEEMRLYNATMRINRLEMLKASIGLELIAGHDELDKFMAEILQGRTEAELARQAGILGKSMLNNTKKAHAIVNASFHNATFSDRIWNNQDQLRGEIGRLLQSGLIQGKNPRALARELRKTFDVSIANSERLMRTELARVQTEAQKQSLQRNGFEMYEFICNHKDGKTCDLCLGMDGKHFKVEDMVPGENAPPLHPNCRCSTAAWEDSAEYDAWLDFLAAGGTTEEWNAQKNAGKTVAKSGESGTINSGSIFDRFDRKSKYTEYTDDLVKTNPNYVTKEYKWRNNCQRCVPTYEMRRRGYNVTAKPIPTKLHLDTLANNYAVAWQNQERVWCMKGSGLAQIKAQMAQWGDGSRAEVCVCWVGGNKGHVFVAEQRNGNTYFLDPQSGSEDCSDYFKNAAKGRTSILRIDNNFPSDYILECCENGG